MSQQKFLATPVLLLIFNRPDTTQMVLDRIRQVQPRYLYVAADGPRDGHATDQDNCERTREIIGMVDWEAEVHTLFRDENLGCALAVSQGISWFFDHVPAGIILEDDCLPDPSFFSFCENLLNYYENESSIMHISGSCNVPAKVTGPYSYYFSMFEHVWGWATWRRAWNNYDLLLQDYPEATRHMDLIKNKRVMLDHLKRGPLFTWDYQWYFCITKRNGKCITPSQSLITNTGFGDRSTHTYFRPRWMKKVHYGSILDINHPPTLEINTVADNYLKRNIYTFSPIKEMAKRALRFLKFI
jgi:hypothetical protein